MMRNDVDRNQEHEDHVLTIGASLSLGGISQGYFWSSVLKCEIIR
jgi:hypothetical protein